MTTIFTQSLTANGAGNEGISFRNFVPITGASLGQVRVTFQSGAGNWTCNHASIAVLGSASVPNVQNTPTELLFGGASGFALGSNSTIISDWVNFSCLSTDTICVIEDNSATASTGTIKFQSSVSGVDHWRKAASASYNLASVSGYSDFTGFIFGFNLIETQAGVNPFQTKTGDVGTIILRAVDLAPPNILETTLQTVQPTLMGQTFLT